MNELPSAEFRKQYAKLTEPTAVTVNGHPIGTWLPAGWGGEIVRSHIGPAGERVIDEVKLAETSLPAKSNQAARDELLRKINRSR